MNNDYYVYELAYPESMGGSVFYVGKGRSDRMYKHADEARRGIQSRKCDTIRQIQAQGEQVVHRKVTENLSHSAAIKGERDLIAFYGWEKLTNRLPGRHMNRVEVRSCRCGYYDIRVSRISQEALDALNAEAVSVGVNLSDLIYMKLVS